jgi:hypothetical protein
MNERWSLLLGSLIPLTLGLICILYRREISHWYYKESTFRLSKLGAKLPQNKQLMYLQTALVGTVMVLIGIGGIVGAILGGGKVIFILLVIAVMGIILASIIVNLILALEK